MSKVNANQIVEIATAVSADIKLVIDVYAGFVQDEPQASDFIMYLDDLAVAQVALTDFLANRDLNALESTLQEQDTFVREMYARTFETIAEVQEELCDVNA